MDYHHRANTAEDFVVYEAAMVRLLGFPGGSVVKNLPASAGDRRVVGSIPGSGRFPQRKKWPPAPVFFPAKSMDRGAWWAMVHGVAKSQTHLSD